MSEHNLSRTSEYNQTKVYQPQPSPPQHNHHIEPSSNVSVVTSKPLFFAQYSIAVIQGFSIYIISALLSIAQLVQFKVFTSNTTSKKNCARISSSSEKSIRGKGNENRHEQEFKNGSHDGLFVKTHVALQRIWPFLSLFLFLGQSESVLQDQDSVINDDDKTTTETITSTITEKSIHKPNGYSNKIRRALVRTISGNLIPRIKRVTFNDQITVLDQEQTKLTLEGVQETTEPLPSPPSSSLPLKSDTTKSFLQEKTPYKEGLSSLNSNQKSNEAIVTTQDPVTTHNPVTTKISNQPISPVQNALATTLFSVLSAHAAAPTVNTKATTRSTSATIDAASSMLMTIPITITPSVSVLAGNLCRETDTNRQGNKNSPELKRSRSAPSKTSAFFQKYRENQQLRQRQQQQQSQPQQQQQQPQLESFEQLDSNTNAFPCIIVTQHSDNAKNSEQDNTSNLTIESSETRHPTTSSNTPSTLPHASAAPIQGGRPRSSSTSVVSQQSTRADSPTSAASRIFQFQKPIYSLRRRSLNLDSLNSENDSFSNESIPSSSLVIEQQQQQQQQQQGSSLEQRKFIYRIAHPQKYKREIMQGRLEADSK